MEEKRGFIYVREEHEPMHSQGCRARCLPFPGDNGHTNMSKNPPYQIGQTGPGRDPGGKIACPTYRGKRWEPGVLTLPVTAEEGRMSKSFQREYHKNTMTSLLRQPLRMQPGPGSVYN